jgi:hypothetical protein
MTVLAERVGSYDRAVVIGAGYNDPTAEIAAAVDQLVAEARHQGIPHVVWLTYREAGHSGRVAQYEASNSVLRAKAAEYPELVLADWAERSRSLPASWFSRDGLHLGAPAATAMAGLIADTLDLALRGVDLAATPPPHCTSTATSGTLPPMMPPATEAAPPGGVHVLQPPVRLLDTRSLSGSLGAGLLAEVEVAGAGGVPDDAVAALVTMTAVEPCADAFLAAFPCGSGVPTTAVLNARAGTIVANSAVVRLGDGLMCVYANRRTDVVVDITGWIGPGGASTVATTPTRIVDTRPGEDQAIDLPQQRLSARSLLSIDVASLPDIAPGTTAVTINLAAAAPTAAGFLTVLPGPCSSASLPPATATLTVAAHRDGAASATVGIGDGQICVYSNVATDVVVDLQATHGAAGAGSISAISPRRLIDTRFSGRAAVGTVLTLEPRALMPAIPDRLKGAVINVTAVDPAGDGYVVVYACGLTQRPFVSNLNVARVTVANRALVSTSGGSSLCVFTTVETDVVIDVEAWTL